MDEAERTRRECSVAAACVCTQRSDDFDDRLFFGASLLRSYKAERARPASILCTCTSYRAYCSTSVRLVRYSTHASEPLPQSNTTSPFYSHAHSSALRRERTGVTRGRASHHSAVLHRRLKRDSSSPQLPVQVDDVRCTRPRDSNARIPAQVATCLRGHAPNAGRRACACARLQAV